MKVRGPNSFRTFPKAVGIPICGSSDGAFFTNNDSASLASRKCWLLLPEVALKKQACDYWQCQFTSTDPREDSLEFSHKQLKVVMLLGRKGDNTDHYTTLPVYFGLKKVRKKMPMRSGSKNILM